MCLIVFAWRPGYPQPLIVAANRDEYHARPTLALHEWPQVPGLIAGRDLQAGGTWMGFQRAGRFAALTNIRAPQQPLAQRSRGDLVAEFLSSDTPLDTYLQALPARAGAYAGFNLLLGDGQRLCHFNSREGTVREVPAGVHGVSNASLDTPWPKLRTARQGLADCLADATPERLFALLADPQPASDAELPATGVGLATEKMLSSVFIDSPAYGTRASTLLWTGADGTFELIERSFGPAGQRLEDRRFGGVSAFSARRD